MSDRAFTKQDSLALKGIAILMMLWHHCFLAGRFETYTVNFWPLAMTQVVHIATFFKICVSLFAFVSGYGLYCSYTEKKKGLTADRWIAVRLVRVLKEYWLVLVLAWVICAAIDGRTAAFYFDKGALYGLWRMLVEFFGLSNFFGLDPFNGTWWYMSAAVVYVFLAPVAVAAVRKLGKALLLVLAVLAGGRLANQFPGYLSPFSFFPIFALGMAFADGRWFETIHAVLAGSPLRRLCGLVAGGVAVLGGYKLYYCLPTDRWWDVKWGLIPLVVILFAKEYIFPLPGVRNVLAFFGKHATNMFLTHTFIRYYYCTDLTYRFGAYSFAAVILFLLGISLAMSYCIELLKKAIRYDAVTGRLEGWLQNTEKEEMSACSKN